MNKTETTKSWEQTLADVGWRLEMKSVVDEVGCCWRAIAIHRLTKKRRTATGRKAEDAYKALLEKIEIDRTIYKALLEGRA